jgi:primosomal protein N''
LNPAPVIDTNVRVTPFDFKPEYDPYFDEPMENADRGDALEVEVEQLQDAPEPAPEPVPETTDEVPEPEPEPEPEVDAAQAKMIPKARLDEVISQRKQLAAEVERLRQELAARQTQPEPTAPVVPEYDFAAKEKEYMEAVLDGDTDKALAIRNDIRQAEFQAIQQQVAQSVPRADEAAAAVQQQLANQAALQEVNTAFPVFDPDSDSFDVDLTEEAVAIAKGFIQFRGLDYASAIRKAAEQVATLNGITRAGAAAPEPAKAKPAPDPKAVAAKLEAANRQPPTAPAQQVAGEDVIDPMSMSEDEFMRLPASVKARLRGDML